MIDDTRDFVTDNEEAHVPPPPRFDERASAKAQPVQPLSTSGPRSWMQRARGFQRKMGVKTKTLALVVFAGLAMGAASGAMLANRHQSSLPTPVIEHSNVETAATEDAIKATASMGDTTGAQTAATAAPRPARIRRHRPVPKKQTQPRAYRVSVLK